MALPFLMQYNSFHHEYRDIQLIGITAIGIAFLLAESLSLYFSKSSNNPSIFTFNSKLLIFTAGIIILIQIAHLVLMPEIPILSYLHNFKSDQNLTKVRESASKLLHIPEIIKYMFQVTNVIAPALAVILLKKYKLFASIFIIITLVYSFSTTAKTMTVMYLAILFIPIYYNYKVPRLIFNFSVIFFTTLLAIASFAYYQKTTAVTSSYTTIESKQIRTYTVADNYRVMGLLPFEEHENRSSSLLEARLKGLFYRAILVPAEVSHIWYSYYPAVKGEFLGFYGLTPGSRESKNFVHPSNEVGIWAYVNKYPKDYLSSIHAYSSIDAEIYSRFGLSGVFVIAILLFIIVYVLQPKTTNFKDDESNVFKFSGLLLIALFSSMASLQAMLIAHGLLFIFIFLLIIKLTNYKLKS